MTEINTNTDKRNTIRWNERKGTHNSTKLNEFEIWWDLNRLVHRSWGYASCSDAIP